MKILRTPDERFQNLSDYEFEPHYVDIDEMRMHFVDEGPPMRRLYCFCTENRAGPTFTDT